MKKIAEGDKFVFTVTEVHDKGYTLSPGGYYMPKKYADMLVPLKNGDLSAEED